MTSYLIYSVVGKLIIYLVGKFLSDSRVKFISKFASCGLCSGFWVYTLLSWGTSVFLFSDIFSGPYLVMGIVTGAVTTFLVHLISVGYREQFSVVVIN